MVDGETVFPAKGLSAQRSGTRQGNRSLEKPCCVCALFCQDQGLLQHTDRVVPVSALLEQVESPCISLNSLFIPAHAMLALSQTEKQPGDVLRAPCALRQVESATELLKGILETVHLQGALARQAIVVSRALHAFRSSAVKVTSQLSRVSFEITGVMPFQHPSYLQMKRWSPVDRYLLNEDVLDQSVRELVKTGLFCICDDYAVGNCLLKTPLEGRSCHLCGLAKNCRLELSSSESGKGHDILARR